jgi:hypothetical protein
MIYILQNTEVIELTSDYIEYLYQSYLPDNCLVVPDTVTDIDYIQSLSGNFSYVIFDHGTNPFDPTDKLSALISLDIPFYILSGSYSYFNNSTPDLRVKFFPFWARWVSSQQYQFSHSPKQYKVSCLNGTPWEHRKLIYLNLVERSYFKDMVFTFSNRPGYEKIPSQEDLSLEQQQRFDQLSQTVTFVDGDATRGIDVTTDHPAYQETLVNLVTETTVSASMPMLSEKTFKPIVSGQLFILIASPGAIQFLRDAGIDTFDDIIDHNYDTITDSKERITAAIAQVDHLMTLDIPAVYDQIKIRLQKNSEYYKSDKFRKQFPLTFND